VPTRIFDESGRWLVSRRPKVSFVVICYNTEKYVGDAITSILDQDGPTEFEILAVDDASQDRTAEVLRGFGDPRLKIIVNDVNRGAMRTCEIGLRAARGEYVTRFDSDDRY